MLCCVATQTFHIKKVRTYEPEDDHFKKCFKPYWLNGMQVIHAVNTAGKEGVFLDNKPGRLFMDQKVHEKDARHFFDPVPGYDWETMENQDVDGCTVSVRDQFNADWKTDPRNESRVADKREQCLWLQKWAW